MRQARLADRRWRPPIGVLAVASASSRSRRVRKAAEGRLQDKSRRFYGPDELALLASVLEKALKDAVIVNGTPVADVDLQDLGARLGRVIMDHFAAGETDAEVLKKIALERVGRRGQASRFL
jgi:hypothetical protein